MRGPAGWPEVTVRKAPAKHMNTVMQNIRILSRSPFAVGIDLCNSRSFSFDLTAGCWATLLALHLMCLWVHPAHAVAPARFGPRCTQRTPAFVQESQGYTNGLVDSPTLLWFIEGEVQLSEAVLLRPLACACSFVSRCNI